MPLAIQLFFAHFFAHAIYKSVAIRLIFAQFGAATGANEIRSNGLKMSNISRSITLRSKPAQSAQKPDFQGC